MARLVHGSESCNAVAARRSGRAAGTRRRAASKARAEGIREEGGWANQIPYKTPIFCCSVLGTKPVVQRAIFPMMRTNESSLF
jgi:hypothetical protein